MRKDADHSSDNKKGQVEYRARGTLRTEGDII